MVEYILKRLVAVFTAISRFLPIGMYSWIVPPHRIAEVQDRALKSQLLVVTRPILDYG